MRPTNLLIVAALSAASLFTKADQIAPEVAMQIAQREIAAASNTSVRGLRSARVAETLTLAHTAKSSLNEEENCFYVFNRSNGGFVVAAADDCANSVLAVIDEGSFDADSIPSSIAWWFDKCQEEISMAMMEGLTTSTSSSESTTSTTTRANVPAVQRSSVSPLLTSTWSQNAPYNQDCVFTNSDGTEYTAVAGCVPVALAQVMRYHQWPQEAVDFEYTTKMCGTVSISETFDWDNMPDQLTSSSSDAEKSAVASLIRNAGKSVFASYSATCTSALEDYIVATASRIFGYSKSVSYRTRYFYTDREWENIVINELQNNRPVIYTGGSAAYRHCFVVDGYDVDQNLFHLNLGWGGVYNGYYSLSTLKVSYMNFNGGARGENVIVNLRRPADDDKLDIPFCSNGNLDKVRYCYTTTAGKRKIQILTQTTTESYYLTTVSLTTSRFTTFANYELDYWSPEHTIYQGIRATDIETGEVQILESPLKQRSTGLYDNSQIFGYVLGDSYFEIGHSYKIELLYHEEDTEEWKPMVFAPNCCETAILTRNEDDTYSIVPEYDLPNIEFVSFETNTATVNSDLDVVANVKNTGGVDFFGDYTVTLYDSSETEVASQTLTVEIAAGSSAALSYQFSLDGLTAGNYTLKGAVEDEDPTDPYAVTVTSGVFTAIDSVNSDDANVTVTDSEISVSANDAAIEIYNMAGQMVAAADENSLSIEQLTPGIYVAKISADGEAIVKKFSK